MPYDYSPATYPNSSPAEERRKSYERRDVRAWPSCEPSNVGKITSAESQGTTPLPQALVPSKLGDVVDLVGIEPTTSSMRFNPD